MIAYYNEIDPFAAQWLENLSAAEKRRSPMKIKLYTVTRTLPSAHGMSRVGIFWRADLMDPPHWIHRRREVRHIPHPSGRPFDLNAYGDGERDRITHDLADLGIGVEPERRPGGGA